jgi:hypothetical protein
MKLYLVLKKSKANVLSKKAVFFEMELKQIGSPSENFPIKMQYNHN